MTGSSPSGLPTSAAPWSTGAAEAAWLERWSAGPVETDLTLVREGQEAPDLRLPDQSGRFRRLSEFWTSSPALLMFWRHFGCSCGSARAVRLSAEWSAYLAAGLDPVIIALGDPSRARAYREVQGLSAPILSDPQGDAYRAYGIGHWPVERVLYDAPAPFLGHPRELGTAFQDERRDQGRPPVDDPWRATAEFVIARGGRVRLAYGYQYCEDFPDPRVITAAAGLCA